MGALAHELAAADAVKLETAADGSGRVLLSGDDVSTAIRTQHVASGASMVSAIPEVRAALLEMQRKTGEDGGVVLEGRDIGTVVFPDAEAKFFLTASVDVRADRRLKELAERGHIADLDTIRREVAERDQRDSQRAVAPLKRAEDAVLVDSSELPVDAVVRLIVSRVKEVERRLRDG